MTKGWEKRRLGDVATLQRGFDLPTRNRVNGSFPLVSSSGIIDTHNVGPIRAPGVATGRSGSIGNVFYIEADFWPLNTALFVNDFHGNDPRFVYHLLKSFNLSRFASGAGVPTLNRNSVHDEIVSVPPLAEQQRIVGILDEAFAGIATAKANAEKNRQNARALFESHLNAVFTHRGPEWEEKTLISLCSLFVDSAHRTPKYQEDGVPALRPRDVVNGRLNLDGAQRVSEVEYELQSKRHKPRPGDIVYSRELSLGWAAILPKSSRVCLSQGMCVFRPCGELDGRYLLYVLNSPVGRKQARRASVGAAHPHINLSDIKAYRIPLPPLRVQRDITRRFDALGTETQRLARLYERKLAALDELKKSLLHQAFTGEL